MPAGEIIDLMCERCGSPFQEMRKRRGRHSRYCSPKCRLRARAEQRAAYLAQGRYQFGVTCAVCGKLFDAYYRQSSTCSPACARELKSRSRRAKVSAKSNEARARQAIGDLFATAVTSARRERSE